MGNLLKIDTLWANIVTFTHIDESWYTI